MYAVYICLTVFPFAGEAEDGDNGELEIFGVFKIY